MSGILGIGWPWQPSTGGIPPQVADADAVRANLLNLYSTQPGDDKTDPQRGLDLLGFVWATTSTVLGALIEAEVIRVTTIWEPRVSIDSVKTTVRDELDGTTTIDVLVEYVFQGVKNTVGFSQPQGGTAS